jgi:hypothetical protein
MLELHSYQNTLVRGAKHEDNLGLGLNTGLGLS